MPTRRTLLAATAAAPLAAFARADEPAPAAPRFRLCLNTATIRGRKLGVEREAEVAAAAGYTGIEPWIGDLERYRDGGGSVPDLAKKFADLGLTVESAIGFADWINDDDGKRAAGLERAKRDMALLRGVGGTRIAAPPVGGRTEPITDLAAIAERYAALCEVGRDAGVVPQLEVWGFAATLSRLGEAVYVAAESSAANACLLLDAYHVYKGGSGFEGLHLLGPRSMHVFHINDYPADPPRETITDAARVMPGDGVAPLGDILRTFAAIGFDGALSLELFNPGLWERDPSAVAREGREKIEATVAAAFGG